MTGKPSVLIAYDGSPDADLALNWGIQVAERTRADVAVMVVTLPPGRLPTPIRESEEAHATAAANAARDALKAADITRGTVRVEYGWTLPMLLNATRTASLVVVGSRGHNRYEGHWLGSVSQHLASHAPCAVAVIRPANDPLARLILVGVDGSPASVRALESAARRAEMTGESVLAVHGYQVLGLSGGGIGSLPTDIDADAIAAAERLAAELVAGIAIDHPDVDLRSTAVLGRPGRVLARLSDQASLVVIGSRGRTPVQELLLGSVSQEVLYRAECPVVVMR